MDIKLYQVFLGLGKLLSLRFNKGKMGLMGSLNSYCCIPMILVFLFHYVIFDFSFCVLITAISISELSKHVLTNDEGPYHLETNDN